MTCAEHLPQSLAHGEYALSGNSACHFQIPSSGTSEF